MFVYRHMHVYTHLCVSSCYSYRFSTRVVVLDLHATPATRNRRRHQRQCSLDRKEVKHDPNSRNLNTGPTSLKARVMGLNSL